MPLMHIKSRFICVSVCTLVLGLAAPAAAQEPAPNRAGAASEASVAPAPVVPPAANAVPAPVVPPAANEAAPVPTCRLGVHAGTRDEDAVTVASLVCRELEGKPAAQGHHYRVDLDALGASTFLTLTDEDQTGSAGVRRMQLRSIEEAADGAPRIASAMLSGKSVGETERVGNLTEVEARAPLHKAGSFKVGVGVLGVYAPSVATLAPGFELGLRYDTPTWVAHTSLRYAAHVGSDERGEDEGLRLFDWGVGARYMLGQQDVAPFVGAGLAFMAVQRNTHSENGLGAFGEVGLEMLRLHKNHVGVALRADAPMFAVSSRYVMPLSLAVSMTFD